MSPILGTIFLPPALGARPIAVAPLIIRVFPDLMPGFCHPNRSDERLVANVFILAR
jgi:hypothetical protein